MNISQWQHYLLQEMEEDLSLKQQNIAKQTKPVDKITGSDFKALRAKKGMKEDESQTDWPKEIPSRYHDEFLFIYDESKPGFYDVKDLKTGEIVGKLGFKTPEKAIEFAQDKVKPIGGTQSSQFESEDHEVSMANNSLESIIKAAMELKVKLGDNEKDIPAWIQDHITNAANFISQAAENYHEYGEEDENMISIPQGFNEGAQDVINDYLLVLKRVLTQLKTITQKGNKLVDKEQVIKMIDMVLNTLGEIESYKA